MTATLTPEDIEAFEQAHGFASFGRCRIAERRTRIAQRSLGDDRITPSMLMRQVEARIACTVINRMTSLGMPVSRKAA